MTQSASYQAPFRPGGESPIDAEIARKLLTIALSRGGEYADLFFEYQAGGAISFEEGITRSASRGVSMGLGVRVQMGDATGYAHVEDLSWDAMKRAAETAARIAQGGKTIAPLAIERMSIPSRYELDRVSIDLPGVDKRSLLERASRAAMAHDPRIIKAEASFVEEVREILIATSDGRLVHDVQPLILLDARPAPAGQMEVILAPGDSGILLHEAVGHGLEADFNRKGTSNYTGQVGKPVASDLCTVVDDPTFLQSRGSINVDDEGIEPRKSVLIENGVLRGYLQDRLSAKHFGVGFTGNGRRESFACAPMPRMTNTVLLAGPHDPEEMLKSVKRGIYAKTFGGGQVDISNGDFVFSLTESYLVEDGKLTTPLKGVNLIGNGPETLRDVTMLGNDVAVSDGIWTCGKDGQSVPVGVGCPTIKIARITVGGTEIS